MNRLDYMPPSDESLESPNDNIYNSASGNAQDSPFQISKDIIMFLQVVYCPLTVLSNGVILLAGILNPLLRKTPTDIIIIGLAFADFSVGAMSIPVYIINDIPETTSMLKEKKIACVSRWFIPLFTQGLSLAMFFLLSFERFVAINWPFFYIEHASRMLTVMCISVFYLIEFSIPFSVLTFEMKFNESEPNIGKRCNFMNIPKWYSGLGLTVHHAIYVIPTFLLSIQIIFVVVRQMYKIRKMSKSVNARQPMKRKNVTVLFILMALFIPLWVPTLVLYWTWQLPDFETARLYDLWTRPLRLIYSLINSFVYTFSKKLMRSACLFILTKPPTRWCKVREFVRQSLVTETTRQNLAAARSRRGTCKSSVLQTSQLEYHPRPTSTSDSTSKSSTAGSYFNTFKLMEKKSSRLLANSPSKDVIEKSSYAGK